MVVISYRWLLRPLLSVCASYRTNVGRLESPGQAKSVLWMGNAPIGKRRVGRRGGVVSLWEGVERARSQRLIDTCRALIGMNR